LVTNATSDGKLIRTRPRVGILTLTQSGNYGTALQAYSTLRIFQASTDEVEFRVIRTDIKKLRRRRLLRKISPRGQSVGITHTKNYVAVQQFVRQHVVGDVPYVDISDREAAYSYLNAEFDAFISGSDEIWNLADIGTKSLYYIPPSLGRYRASFATSANRLDTKTLTSDQLAILRESLNNYDYISVRDTTTKNFALQNLSSSVTPIEIVDPTLIYDFPELGPSINRRDFSNATHRKRILLMITNPRIASAMVLRYGDIADIDTVFVRHKGAKYLSLTPFQFATVFGNYDLVVTNFFHGTCMCIRNRVPFISFDHEALAAQYESKVANIMRKLGLVDNYINIAELGMVTGIEQLLALSARILNGEHRAPDIENVLTQERSDGLRVAAEISKGIVARTVKSST
jgi:Polysaccharide pyruvyl transferase